DSTAGPNALPLDAYLSAPSVLLLWSEGFEPRRRLGDRCASSVRVVAVDGPVDVLDQELDCGLRNEARNEQAPRARDPAAQGVWIERIRPGPRASPDARQVPIGGSGWVRRCCRLRERLERLVAYADQAPFDQGITLLSIATREYIDGLDEPSLGFQS